MRPDMLLARVLDRLNDAHAGICLESRGRRNGGKHPGRYSADSLEVNPLGRPAMVTSMPPP
jgi:hypothetical protein